MLARTLTFLLLLTLTLAGCQDRQSTVGSGGDTGPDTPPVATAPVAADQASTAGTKETPPSNPQPQETPKPEVAAGKPHPKKGTWPPRKEYFESEPPELDRFGTSHKPACEGDWYVNDVPTALQRAKDEGKVALLIFEKSDCHHCRHFNEIQLADPEFCQIMQAPGMVVCKRFYSSFEKQRYNIKATPMFVAYRIEDGKEILVEYLPGLLEDELMKKRLRDVSNHEGRFGKLRDALEADPQDIEVIKVLADEYLDLFPPNEKIRLIRQGMNQDPEWTHGIALYLYVLHTLTQQGVQSAPDLMKQFVGGAKQRLEQGTLSARDYFILGYAQLTAAQSAPQDQRENAYTEGMKNLEKSIELNPRDAEVLSHASWGYVALAGLAKLADDEARACENMFKAEDAVRKAKGYAPGSALPETRQQWVNEQWKALELDCKK